MSFQRTARLAGLDHVHIQPVEALGALGHRLRRAWSRLRSRRTTSSSEYLSRPGLGWPARIRRLRRIGRPASCRIESCRVNVVRSLAIRRRRRRSRASSWPPVGRRPSCGLLGRDLRDEVAHLTNRRLGFFLGRGLDDVLDLLRPSRPSPRIEKLACVCSAASIRARSSLVTATRASELTTAN